VRCGRCGNENAEGFRFCGMCGAALVAKEQAGPAVSSTPPEPRTAPTITGPSFLGLNMPADETSAGRGSGTDRNAGGGNDALRPSSNVNYLLEDDDEPRRGWGKVILIVVALALAVGFGYLHWKQGGFDWLNGGDKKPAAATAQAPEAGQSGADSGAAKPASAGGAGAQDSSGAPVAGGSASVSPAESGAGQSAGAQTSSQATPSESGAAPSASAQTATPANTDQASSAPASGAAQSTPQNSAPGSSAPPETGTKAADSGADTQSPAAEPTPRAVARKPAATKPTAAKPAAKAADSVTEAERYIYGSGLAQDCDRGLRMLKSAAESNVKAMVSMGVLYSTGTCAPRDLPTAYRWFALALHKEPDNQALQDDLQKLWGKMTPPERQLAIKLSQ
jgi:TPR repeat protein